MDDNLHCSTCPASAHCRLYSLNVPSEQELSAILAGADKYWLRQIVSPRCPAPMEAKVAAIKHPSFPLQYLDVEVRRLVRTLRTGAGHPKLLYQPEFYDQCTLVRLAVTAGRLTKAQAKAIIRAAVGLPDLPPLAIAATLLHLALSRVADPDDVAMLLFHPYPGVRKAAAMALLS